MFRSNINQRRQWQLTPVLLPGKSHGQRSLVSCSPWGQEESDMTERLHFHFSLSCIGEGNGNPLQCSCLEHPRDGGAWWAAVYGVAQSQTWLKLLSSSSNINMDLSTGQTGEWHFIVPLKSKGQRCLLNVKQIVQLKFFFHTVLGRYHKGTNFPEVSDSGVVGKIIGIRLYWSTSRYYW